MKISMKSVASLAFLFSAASAFSAALHETVGGPDTASTVVNVQGALMSADATTLPGANIGFGTRISRRQPLYMGAEAGVFAATGTPSYAVVPLLFSFYYQFEPRAAVHPLLGVLSGPAFTTGDAYSSTRWELLFRPGLNFELGREAALNVEARVGTIGSTFVFLPEVGAVFPM